MQSKSVSANKSDTNQEECIPCIDNSIIQVSDILCRILSGKQEKETCSLLKEKVVLQEISTKQYTESVSELIKEKDQKADDILSLIKSKVKQ